jgi:hypothetical protein
MMLVWMIPQEASPEVRSRGPSGNVCGKMGADFCPIRRTTARFGRAEWFNRRRGSSSPGPSSLCVVPGIEAS